MLLQKSRNGFAAAEVRAAVTMHDLLQMSSQSAAFLTLSWPAPKQPHPELAVTHAIQYDIQTLHWH